MNSNLKLLKKHLKDKEYSEAFGLYKKLANSNYPKSILNYYSNLYPYLSRNLINQTRNYAPISVENAFQGHISHTPMVSIIIVASNSTNLKDCLESIKSQSYKNWELILIDNGNGNGNVQSEEPTTNIIKFAKTISCKNASFTEANNTALRHCDGELLLLINPNITLEEDCLKDMVSAAKEDRNAAAVVPKTYFYGKFARLAIQCKSLNYSIDYNHLLAQLDHKNIFIRHGSIDENRLKPDERGELLLDIPLHKNSEVLALSVQSEESRPRNHQLKIKFLKSKMTPQFFTVETELTNTVAHINLDQKIHLSSRFLINSAGSAWRKDGTPYDIGFGQEDHGEFNTNKYVDCLEGYCVMLRRELFIKRKLFITEFFNDYEYAELSHWINANKLKILYTNTATYHRHSTVNQESNPVEKILSSRSKNIFEYIKQYNEENFSDEILSTYEPINYADLPRILKSKLEELDQNIIHLKLEDLAYEKNVAIGIYNSFWSSMGGGEKHALDFAAKFNDLKNTRVYLLSEQDFSIPELSKYFKLDLSNCQKIICGEIREELTGRFDVFINSTYRSNLASIARLSYYIVSFPHQNISSKALSSYTFLHNSHFTASWAKKYWGRHTSKVIMPIQQFSPTETSERYFRKQKTCLTVGRFNYVGHCKNQDLIIKAFNQAISQCDSCDDWELVVVGSMDQSSGSSVQHYEECQRIAGQNVRLMPNIERDKLSELYSKASIYIHATGLNVNRNRNPRLCEHFGITVFEALLNGCYPILHNSAGPKEQVKDLTYSTLYDDESDLKNAIQSTIDNFEKGLINKQEVFMSIRNHSCKILEDNRIEIDQLIAEAYH